PGAFVELVVAQPQAPFGVKLIHALDIPARLMQLKRFGRRREYQRSIAAAGEPLGYQLEVLILGVAIRRPLVDEVDAVKTRVADEWNGRPSGILDIGNGRAAAISGCAQRRDAHTIAAPCADVIAYVRKQRSRAHAVLVA